MSVNHVLIDVLNELWTVKLIDGALHHEWLMCCQVYLGVIKHVAATSTRLLVSYAERPCSACCRRHVHSG